MAVIHSLWSFIIRCFKMFILSGAAVLGVMTTIILVLVVIAAMSAGAAATSSSSSEKFSDKKLEYGKENADTSFLAIDIKGVILGEPSGPNDWASLFHEGVTYGYNVKEQLHDAADDKDIAGVILMIDSPGGTIFGSQAIADGVAYYKSKTNKPVIAYVGGMAASGAYWSAVSTDEIIADHGTASGSIGVIFGPFKYYDKVTSEDGGAFMGGVVTQGGIETTYITAGRSKDVGNPYRKLTDQEIATFQESVNDSYQEFVTMVSTHRNIPAATITDQLGALVYGEKQAQKNHLIDAIGSKEDAFTELAKKAGVNDDNFKIIREEASNSFLSTVFGAAVHGTQTKQASAICTLHSQVMAYHGDVASLCP